MFTQSGTKTKKSIWKVIHQDLGFFNVCGRISRLRYATYVASWIAFIFLTDLIAKPSSSNVTMAVLSSCFYIVFLVNLLMLSIRRIKDFQPPKWSFPILLLLNSVLPILLLVPGTKSDNLYGKNIHDSNLRLFSILVVMIGLIFMFVAYGDRSIY